MIEEFRKAIGRRVRSVRYEMLKHFQLYKIEHKESILDHLKKHNIEKK